jgi:hypothetical protein
MKSAIPKFVEGCDERKEHPGGLDSRCDDRQYDAKRRLYRGCTEAAWTSRLQHDNSCCV